MGYADIGPFQAQAYPTPHLDRMAAEGMRFTDFLVSSAVCSASRAALLTGCYHQRVGIDGALGPHAEHGIHADEVTLAEICRQQGYATACIGKWHLGHQPQFLPTQHGFDTYFGLPYSNDMWPLHPMYANLPPASAKRKRGFPPLPLIENSQVVNPHVDGQVLAQLTTCYTARAVTFIEQHKDQPFLLYLPHTMVHVPLFVSDTFRGQSGHGIYGDAVMEIDWSMGQILESLRKNQLDEKTLVIFTSDNGPWLSYGDHAGAAAPFREGKGTTFEGGCRVPTLMRWPGRIPAGQTCDELASTIDVLPTVAGLIGAELPRQTIDGKDIAPLMFGVAGAESPHAVFCYYYAGGELQAVRDRRWKLHFPHRYRTLAGRPGGTQGVPAPYVESQIGQALYDLKADRGETRNVADDHPDIVERLQRGADQAREELGDALTGQPVATSDPPECCSRTPRVCPGSARLQLRIGVAGGRASDAPAMIGWGIAALPPATPSPN